MEKKEFEPFFDLTRASGISNYVKYWLDEYNKHILEKSKFLEKLKVVFSKDSAHQLKILYGNDLSAVFRQRLGKKRQRNLKNHLEEIDKKSYGNIKWD